MGYQNRRGSVLQRVGEDFARVDDGAVDRTDRDDSYADHLMRAVEADTEEVLTLSIGVVPDDRQEVLWKADSVFGRTQAAAGVFECGAELGGLGRTYSGNCPKGIYLHYWFGGLIEHMHQSCGYFLYGIAFDPRTDDEGCQF